MSEPVLVLRALGLGDALTGVPALRGLRRLHPHRPLVLAAPEVIGHWFTDLGLVDGFVATTGLDDDPPGRALGPHDAVNLHGRGPQSHALLVAGNPRSLLAFAPPEGQDGGSDPRADANTRRNTDPLAGTLPRLRDDEHEVLRWCRLVTWAGGTCGPADLRLGSDLHAHPPHVRRTIDASWAPRTQERTASRKGSVQLHPGAASGSRRWPVDRWVEVAHVLSRQGDVLLTGSDEERPLCEAVAGGAGLPATSVLAGSLGLSELLALVRQSQLLVCGDTGVAHVATATGTPSVLLFGPTSPGLWGPIIDRDRHVCLWHGDGTGDPHGERLDPALQRISPDEVLEAADALLTRDLGVA